MNDFDRLIQFIDRHTDCGREELPEIFGEGVGVEDEGLAYLAGFSSEDWQKLQNYWPECSDCWVEALIYLLARLDRHCQKDILVAIVLSGRKGLSWSAIEFVRDFIHELSPEVREKIDRAIGR